MSIDLLSLRVGATAEKPAAAEPTSKPPGAGSQVAGEFASILRGKLDDLVDVTTESARLDRDFAAGKTENIHEVMVAAAKSGLAVETALQIRNLAVRAYTTLTQLR